jgi:hypothetical protein
MMPPSGPRQSSDAQEPMAKVTQKVMSLAADIRSKLRITINPVYTRLMYFGKL